MFNFRDHRIRHLLSAYLDDCVRPKVKCHGYFQPHFQMETAIVMNFRDVTGHWGGLLWITPQKKWFLGRWCLSVSEEILGYVSCLLWAFQAVYDESLYLCITTWFGPKRMPLLVMMQNTLRYTVLGSFSLSTSGKKFVPAEGCQMHGLWILRSFLVEDVRLSKRARLLFWTSFWGPAMLVRSFGGRMTVQ